MVCAQKANCTTSAQPIGALNDCKSYINEWAALSWKKQTRIHTKRHHRQRHRKNNQKKETRSHFMQNDTQCQTATITINCMHLEHTHQWMLWKRLPSHNMIRIETLILCDRKRVTMWTAAWTKATNENKSLRLLHTHTRPLANTQSNYRTNLMQTD